MPHFSHKSLEKLNQCDPELQLIFKTVIKYIDCSVICGHRTEKEQNKVLKNGKSKVGFPLSKHNTNPSLAVDVVPYPVDWEDKNRFYYFGGFVMATYEMLYLDGKVRKVLRWGGDWNRNHKFDDQKFHDLPHFELT